MEFVRCVKVRGSEDSTRGLFAAPHLECGTFFEVVANFGFWVYAVGFPAVCFFTAKRYRKDKDKMENQGDGTLPLLGYHSCCC